MIKPLYPEVEAGGYTRRDGTVNFFTRVQSILKEGDTVLNLGAGRGAVMDDDVPFRRDLQDVRRRGCKVIGLDVDEIVLQNPFLDEAYVLEGEYRFPLADHSVDMVLSDWTFEHVQNPEVVAAEITRVVKSGGWVCARTPNRHGFIGVLGRAIPNSQHQNLLKYLQPKRKSFDAFPAFYKMNTRRDLKRLFSVEYFQHFTYTHEPEVAYAASNLFLQRLITLVVDLLPSRVESTLFIFLRKRE